MGKPEYKIIKNSIITNNQNYPLMDVAVTFFNHENIVLNILTSFTDNCKYSFNLILVDDRSEDKTLDHILDFMKKVENKQINNWEKIFSIIILQSTNKSNFETICSNIPMNFTMTKYLMFLQGDQIILEEDIDAKLIKVLEENEEIFCVSGRGIQRFNYLREDFLKYVEESKRLSRMNIIKLVWTSIREVIYQGINFQISTADRNYMLVKEDEEEIVKNFLLRGTGGCLDEKFFEKPQGFTPLAEKIFVGQSVMRGPVIYRNNDLRKINGYDADSFYLKFDDHALNLSAFLLLQKVCAYIKVKTYADLIEGATRKRKSFQQIYLSNKYKATRYNRLLTTPLFKLLILKEHVSFQKEIIK